MFFDSRRQWRRCPQLLFYACVVGPSVLYLVILLSCLLPRLQRACQDIPTEHLVIAAVILISLFVHYSVSMAGLALFGAPRPRNQRNLSRFLREGWDSSKRVIFCFVSQGLQEKVLKESVERALSLATQLGLDFSVEVVVDSAIPSDPVFSHSRVSVIPVPRSFQTPNGARFKARSLFFAASKRSVHERDMSNTWIVHCDEDTVITPECIAGLAEFLKHPSSARRCGAGEIKYNIATAQSNAVFQVVDYHRTGEDLGRYRLQFGGFGAALFGSHGSFIVVPAAVEQEIQFDYGPRGSIAEDIYFALRLRELGIPFVWIDGHVREQSPRDVRNFFRQRARWIHGILNACFDPGFAFSNRAVLLVYLAMWRTSIVAGIILLCVLVANPTSPLVMILWGLDMASMATVILVGALRNFEEEPNGAGVRIISAMVSSVVLTPLVCLLETAAVLYAFVLPRDDFFVVEKRAVSAMSLTPRVEIG